MKCIIISCVTVLIAFIWTILPLIGWNEYTLEVSIFCLEIKDENGMNFFHIYISRHLAHHVVRICMIDVVYMFRLIYLFLSLFIVYH
jgi:hypothetical protein